MPPSTNGSRPVAPHTWFLLRGLSRQSRHWFGFDQVLSRALEAPVQLLDLPGTGAHLHVKCPTTVGGIAHFLRRVLPLHTAPIGLLGISLGGMVALECAHLWGPRVSHVVTLNASSRLSPSPLRMQPAAVLVLLQALAEQDVLRRERLIYDISVNAGPAARREYALRGAEIARTAPVTRENALRQLLAAARYSPRTPNAKSLTLASSFDRIVSPACSTHLAAFLRSPLYLHPTAGHDLAVEDPDWVASRVRRWLGREAPESDAAPSPTFASVENQVFLQ